MRINNDLGTWSMRYLQSLQNQQASDVQKSFQAHVSVTRNFSTGTVTEGMRSQINSYREAMASTYNAIGIMNTAGSGIQGISNNVQKMKELATQATSNNLTDDQRARLQEQFSQLSQGINKVVEQTTYDGKRVLGGDIRNMEVQLGTNQEQTSITLPGMGLKNLGLENANLNSVENAQNALKTLDNAIQNVANTKNYVNAISEQLGNAARILSNTTMNITSSVSSLNDTNAARSMMDSIKATLLSQATSGVASQSNTNSMSVLRLLG